MTSRCYPLPTTASSSVYLLAAVADPRLAGSLKDMAHHLAQQDGKSLNHFISIAVAEKISRLESGVLSEHTVLVRQQKLAVASGIISKTLYS
jgi:hypothetical protein